MTDCGATGTALDRVVARIFTNHNSGGDESKQQLLSNLMIHVTGHHPPVPTQQNLPTTQPPNYLSLPSSFQPLPIIPTITSTATTTTTTSSSSLPIETTDCATTTNNNNNIIIPSAAISSSGFVQPQCAQMVSNHQQQQQHIPYNPWTMHQRDSQRMRMTQAYNYQNAYPSSYSSNVVMMQQQHYQQQQQQWMTQMLHEQKLQIIQQQQQLQQKEISKTQQIHQYPESTNLGHEGNVEPVSIDELVAAWTTTTASANEVSTEVNDTVTVGHEGFVHGASIEELTAAWEQVQAEYQKEFNVDVNDIDLTDNNLWTQNNNDNEEEDNDGFPDTYQFVNPESSLTEMEQSHLDFMQEGMRQFHAGNIHSAIRAFELELQHVNGDNATAWRMLGRCHAENDMDRQAIQCLEQAVERDPYCADALLALGVSYVNELNHVRALSNLKAWITQNPKFASLDATESNSIHKDVYGSSNAGQENGTVAFSSQSAFDEVQRLLLHALEYADTTECQADVLEALGVVYNVSRDYEAAIDAFRRACQMRPQDYQLWNKLGATLANSNQCQQALPMYQQALQLKPKYARAWLNYAISQSNLQHYHEAARCYLQTLSLNPAAEHCWSYLRVALAANEQWDMIPFAAAHDLKALHEHFDFVIYDNETTIPTEQQQQQTS